MFLFSKAVSGECSSPQKQFPENVPLFRNSFRLMVSLSRNIFWNMFPSPEPVSRKGCSSQKQFSQVLSSSAGPAPRNIFWEMFLFPKTLSRKRSSPQNQFPGNVPLPRHIFLQMFLFTELFSGKVPLLRNSFWETFLFPRNSVQRTFLYPESVSI